LIGDNWQSAEAAGDPGPRRQRAILGRSLWDAEVLCNIVRECALETLAGEELTKPKRAAPISKRKCNCNAKHTAPVLVCSRVDSAWSDFY